MSMEDDPEGPDYSLADEYPKDRWIRYGGMALVIFLMGWVVLFFAAIVLGA
jgi:hypothetical protein